MNRRAFIKKVALLGAAAVIAPKVLFAKTPVLKPVPGLSGTAFDGKIRYHLLATNQFFPGDFVVMADGKAMHPKTWQEKIIGLAARSIEQGEIIVYDPLGNTGDVVTNNTVFNVTGEYFNEDMMFANRLHLRKTLK